MSTFKTYTATLGAALANSAAITVPYQSGDVAATFTLARPSQVVVGQILYVTPTNATLAYAGSITLTNTSGVTWPAGSLVIFNPQLAVPTDQGGTVVPTPAPTALVDSTTGAASGTLAAITDVPTKNAVASLNAQLNATTTALKSAGVLT